MGGTGLGDRCARLAGEVTEETEDRPGKRWQRPADLRSRIVAYAECARGGEPPGGVSRRPSAVESILARWRRSDRRTPAAGLTPALDRHGHPVGERWLVSNSKASGHASDGRR